ncbi:MAG TPA: hypothetical protein VMU84_18980 [Thermoanaerobaculia bacterium]|nr:hypothetical protein [Thermoanaerobaculia bacterium]
MRDLLLAPYRAVRKRATARRCLRLPGGGKLHVGCGPVHLDGWINIDNRRYPAADYLWDVRDGLPFRGLARIFAEHFLEHLPLWEAQRFLTDCRNALADDGALRLSTPNLDWILATHRGSFELNKAFRGWGHQFLYDAATLTDVLHAAGFSRVEFHAYGESTIPELRGLERHERFADTPELPHVLVIEAHGHGKASDPEGAREFLNALGAF